LARAIRINPAVGASLPFLREPQYDVRSDRGCGLDRLDAGLFVLMILSRAAQSAAAFGGR
jgi:hypothetical protein